MWRSLKTLFALLLLTGIVLAETPVYFPVSGTVTDGGTFYIGKTGMNHSVRIILGAEGVSSIETDYPANVTISSGRAWVDFNAPSTPGPHHLCLDVVKETGLESFCIAYDVVENPLRVITEGNEVSVPEAGSSSFEFYVVNTGVGTTTLIPDCTYPCEGEEIVVYPMKESGGTVTFHSVVSGEYPSEILLKDALSGEVYRIPVTVNVYPTIRGRIRVHSILSDVFLPILHPVRLILGVLFWRM